MKKVRIPAAVTVKALSELLTVSAPQVITYLMSNGVMASMNQSVDYDTAALVADHFGFEAESEEAAAAGEARSAARDLSGEDATSLAPRPPVVTVLGHVDHGKTSLLDRIRQTKVAEGEAGGITQRIGAYQVTRDGRRITFIDTPGHAAFTAMRARGADVTDVAVLVVAADDGVMPQTEEAIQHVRSAGVPIVVAVNKIDRDNANPDRVLQQLAEHAVVGEAYGGDVPMVRTSARTGEGIDDLLDVILLVSDIAEPKANPGRSAVGTVIDSDLERGRGPVATLLVQNGTLRVGDNVVAGAVYGKVRALLDDTGRKVKEAGPSVPVIVTGLNDVVTAGELLQVVDSEKAARTLAEQRSLSARQKLVQPTRRITLADLAAQVAEGKVKSLNLVVKAESNGSLEALRGQVAKVDDPNVRVKIVADGVGPVSESDVNLAAVTGSIVIGFDVRPDTQAKQAAEDQGVDVRFYNVVYQVTDDLERAVKGMYEPTFVEVFQGRAECRRIFTIDGRNAIAGSHVIEGRIIRGATMRVMRDGAEVFRGRIAQLRRVKDDVREVAAGYDCGITVENYTDFEEGDILEAYTVEQQNA